MLHNETTIMKRKKPDMDNELFTNLISKLKPKTATMFNLIVQNLIKNKANKYFHISTFILGLSEDLWVSFAVFMKFIIILCRNCIDEHL